MYHRWRETFILRIKKYEDKTEALKKLWVYKTGDVKIEKARYFAIWKNKSDRTEA